MTTAGTVPAHIQAMKLAPFPIELDPDYRSREQSIHEAGRMRHAEAGEWIQGHSPTPNGPDGVRRGGDGPFLCQVIELRKGKYDGAIDDPQLGGYWVRPWRRTHMAFGEVFFMPFACVLSRTQVNHYSLTGNWPASWPLPGVARE